MNIQNRTQLGQFKCINDYLKYLIMYMFIIFQKYNCCLKMIYKSALIQYDLILDLFCCCKDT